VVVLVIVVLLLDAVFNAVAWPRFLKRVTADPRARDADGRPTRFLTVHRMLVGVALGLAAASFAVAVILAVLAIADGGV
jgi:hypothetical protein